MSWSFVMPDERVVEAFVFNDAWRWRIVGTSQYAEITGLSKSEQGARLRAVLAWRDSAGAGKVPEDALEAVKAA